jgi:hypothetical protein
MIKYYPRAKALTCPVHKAVQAQCIKELIEKQYFSKPEILAALNFEAMSESIRWDYITGFIAQDSGAELVPLAERFFKAANGQKRLTTQERIHSPEKCIASGHGKKTYGYASVFLNDGVYALKIMNYKKNISNGTQAAFDNYVSKLTAVNLINQTPVTLVENQQTEAA